MKTLSSILKPLGLTDREYAYVSKRVPHSYLYHRGVKAPRCNTCGEIMLTEKDSFIVGRAVSAAQSFSKERDPDMFFELANKSYA